MQYAYHSQEATTKNTKEPKQATTAAQNEQTVNEFIRNRKRIGTTNSHIIEKKNERTTTTKQKTNY